MGERPTFLEEASNMYTLFRAGDPQVSVKRVTGTYIKAEQLARQMDKRRRTRFFSRHPVTLRRLRSLGIDPETLRPLSQRPG